MDKGSRYLTEKSKVNIAGNSKMWYIGSMEQLCCKVVSFPKLYARFAGVHKRGGGANDSF